MDCRRRSSRLKIQAEKKPVKITKDDVLQQIDAAARQSAGSRRVLQQIISSPTKTNEFVVEKYRYNNDACEQSDYEDSDSEDFIAPDEESLESDSGASGCGGSGADEADSDCGDGNEAEDDDEDVTPVKRSKLHNPFPDSDDEGTDDENRAPSKPPRQRNRVYFGDEIEELKFEERGKDGDIARDYESEKTKSLEICIDRVHPSTKSVPVGEESDSEDLFSRSPIGLGLSPLYEMQSTEKAKLHEPSQGPTPSTVTAEKLKYKLNLDCTDAEELFSSQESHASHPSNQEMSSQTKEESRKKGTRAKVLSEVFEDHVDPGTPSCSHHDSRLRKSRRIRNQARCAEQSPRKGALRVIAQKHGSSQRLQSRFKRQLDCDYSDSESDEEEDDVLDLTKSPPDGLDSDTSGDDDDGSSSGPKSLKQLARGADFHDTTPKICAYLFSYYTFTDQSRFVAHSSYGCGIVMNAGGFLEVDFEQECADYVRENFSMGDAMELSNVTYSAKSTDKIRFSVLPKNSFKAKVYKVQQIKECTCEPPILRYRFHYSTVADILQHLPVGKHVSLRAKLVKCEPLVSFTPRDSFDSRDWRVQRTGAPVAKKIIMRRFCVMDEGGLELEGVAYFDQAELMALDVGGKADCEWDFVEINLAEIVEKRGKRSLKIARQSAIRELPADEVPLTLLGHFQCGSGSGSDSDNSDSESHFGSESESENEGMDGFDYYEMERSECVSLLDVINGGKGIYKVCVTVDSVDRKFYTQRCCNRPQCHNRFLKGNVCLPVQCSKCGQDVYTPLNIPRFRLTLKDAIYKSSPYLDRVMVHNSAECFSLENMFILRILECPEEPELLAEMWARVDEILSHNREYILKIKKDQNKNQCFYDVYQYESDVLFLYHLFGL